MAQSQQNLILSRLSRDDLALLQPHLEPVDLPLHKILEKANKRITAVYFPESGFASVVVNTGKPIEVGLIGYEGMTGLSLVFGHDRNDNETYMQAAGQGQFMRANALRDAIDRSRSLHGALLNYAHSFLNQTTRTAVANGRSKIEERLARWLLMAHDRMRSPELPLTHEFLAMMLAVRRPGVTVAVQHLEREGVIARRRGRIVICNREKLEKLANGTYVTADYAEH
jgi:CRP-like cAMP-binding protein